MINVAPRKQFSFNSSVRGLKSLAIFLALCVSFATYSSNQDKTLLYLFAVGVFFIAAQYNKISFVGGSVVLLYSFFYGMVSFVSFFIGSIEYGAPSVEVILYPFIFFLMAGALWKVFLLEGLAAKLVLFLFLSNVLVACAPYFGIESLPVIGVISTGRVIFFTSLPSSAGLFWNVNYFAATQAVGFWLLYSMLKRGTLPHSYRYFVYLVGLSVVMGSSRSITFSLIASLLAYQLLLSNGKYKFAFLLMAGVLSFGASGIVDSMYGDDEISEGLRLYKGLNNRDDLWEAGFEAALQAPFFGYGSPSVVSEKIMLLGATTSTVQNAYLTTQLLFGIFGLLVVYSMVVFAFVKTATLKRVASCDAAVFGLLTFTLLDSAVRSYLVGGIGPIPFLMSASVVYLLRYKEE